MSLPQEHLQAIGTTYYTALGASETWIIVKSTSTLVALLMTSAIDAKDREAEYQLKVENKICGEAMRFHEEDTGKIHAAHMCQGILGRVGTLAYRFGKVPSGGIPLLITHAATGEAKK